MTVKNDPDDLETIKQRLDLGMLDFVFQYGILRLSLGLIAFHFFMLLLVDKNFGLEMLCKSFICCSLAGLLFGFYLWRCLISDYEKKCRVRDFS